MTRQTAVREFLAQKEIAIFGVSLTGKKFGNSVLRELTKKGYQVYGINPKVKNGGERQIYPDLKSLPESVSGIVTVVPPPQTVEVIKEAAKAGIKQVWMQQGSESETAIQFCKEEGINMVAGECILMFAEPVGFMHKLHGWIWKFLGKYPK
jgi:predicted CoA-binding protein